MEKEEITPKETDFDWKKDWKEFLMTLDAKTANDSMIRVNVKNGTMNGLLKNGEEVIEVKWNKTERENEVELIIAHLQNHSMRVLTGSDQGELNEIDMNGFIEKEIVDLNADGRRWEGGVLRGDVFGYGRLYDEENRIEYDGWIIKGKKRCYGIEYWGETGKMMYCGCYYNGLKNGYGVLYDLKGDTRYSGLFNDDCGIGDDTKMEWGKNSDMDLDSYAESLTVMNGFGDMSSLILNVSWFSLKRIQIGNECFTKANQFVIDGLNQLESVSIGWNGFYLNEDNREGSAFMIKNCDRLMEIHVSGYAFYWYESFELKNLPSLISITLDENAFCECHRVIFEDLYRLQSITLGYEALQGEFSTAESNELIMKNLPSLTSFKGDVGCMSYVGKVMLENIQLLTEEGIQMKGSFREVKEVTKTNAESLNQVIQCRSRYIRTSDYRTGFW